MNFQLTWAASHEPRVKESAVERQLYSVVRGAWCVGREYL